MKPKVICVHLSICVIAIILLKYHDSLICNNFTKFSELNFTKNTHEFDTIVLRPLEQANFDDSLDLDGLVLKRGGSLELQNIKSFSYLSNPLRNLKVTDTRKFNRLIIANSTFIFKYQNEYLSSSLCDLKRIEFIKDSFLSYTFNIELNNVHFPQPICPLLFWNTKLFNMEIIKPNTSFEFCQIQNRPLNFTLNCHIDYFRLRNANINNLNSIEHLNVDLLAKTKTIRIENTTISNIDADTFNGFKTLSHLEFNKINFKHIFQQNMKWLAGLNSNNGGFKKYGSKLDFKLYLIGIDYSFRDEDLCQFKYFEPLSNVFLVSRPLAKQFNCTCSFLWLAQNSYGSMNGIDFEISNTLNEYNCTFKNVTDFKQAIGNCNFKAKFAKCNHVEYFALTSKKSHVYVVYVTVGLIGGILMVIVCVLLLLKVIQWKISRNNRQRGVNENNDIELEPMNIHV